MNLMNILRWFVTTIVVGGFLAIFYLNIEAVAEKHGWDQLLLNLGEFVSSFLGQLQNNWILILTTLFLGVAITLWANKFYPRMPAPKKIETSIRLRFFGNDKTPAPISESNIWRWYAMRHITRFSSDKMQQEKSSTTTIIFLAFDKPVSYRHINISAQDFELPLHEVKDNGPRHAIIFFSSDLPSGILSVKFEM